MNFAQYRQVVAQFAKAMERKLVANDHKSHWRISTNAYLKRRLRNEMKELFYALDQLKKRKNVCDRAELFTLMQLVRDEAADVANFAMMIADNNAKLSLEDEEPPAVRLIK